MATSLSSYNFFFFFVVVTLYFLLVVPVFLSLLIFNFLFYYLHSPFTITNWLLLLFCDSFDSCTKYLAFFSCILSLFTFDSFTIFDSFLFFFFHSSTLILILFRDYCLCVSGFMQLSVQTNNCNSQCTLRSIRHSVAGHKCILLFIRGAFTHTHPDRPT